MPGFWSGSCQASQKSGILNRKNSHAPNSNDLILAGQEVGNGKMKARKEKRNQKNSEKINNNNDNNNNKTAKDRNMLNRPSSSDLSTDKAKE